MSEQIHLSDIEIIEKLASHKHLEQDVAFKYMFTQHYRSIMDLVLKNSGDKNDADDVFQDAMIVLYNNARKEDFVLSAKISSYLYGVSRNIWLKKLRSRKKLTNIDDTHKEIVNLEESSFDILQRTEQSNLLNEFIVALGQDCQSVLRYFYYEKMRMEQIAKIMEYANVQVAKNKKHLCLKKLKKAVLNDSRFKR